MPPNTIKKPREFREEFKGLPFKSVDTPENRLIAKLQGARREVGGQSKTPKGETITPPPPRRGDVEVFTSANDGRQSGVELPDGRVFLGLGPQDVKDVTEQQNRRTQVPEGSVLKSEAQFGRERQELGQSLAAQVGTAPPLPAEDVSFFEGLDLGQTGLRTGLNFLPEAIGGISALGVARLFGSRLATAGAVEAAGVGAAGAAGGFLPAIAALAIFNSIGRASDSAIQDIDDQFEERISSKEKVLEDGKQNLADLVSDTNANPQNAIRNLNAFNKQIQLIDRAEKELQIASRGNTKAFDNAFEELAEFEVFNSAGGERENLIREMQTSLLNPDVNKNLISLDVLEKRINTS